MVRKIIVNADTKNEAFKIARKKVFLESPTIKIGVVPIDAKKKPNRKGQFIVSVRRDKRSFR